jgi:hypothetical protein
MRKHALAPIGAALLMGSFTASAQEVAPTEPEAQEQVASPQLQKTSEGSGDAEPEAVSEEGGPKTLSVEEIAAIPMPELAFDASTVRESDFEKYYYFHRAKTDFNAAYADIQECDALSSGISYYRGSAEPYPGYYATQYGIGGVIGSVIGEAIADAIYGSSLRRKTRRINMRNCMGFKGYQRYGLAKSLWREFNFEEGGGRVSDNVRDAALKRQALVASGPKPTGKVLQR